jgi:hypothetical protein
MSQPCYLEILEKRNLEQWSNPQYFQFMRNRWLDFYLNNVEYRENLLSRLDALQKIIGVIK